MINLSPKDISICLIAGFRADMPKHAGITKSIKNIATKVKNAIGKPIEWSGEKFGTGIKKSFKNLTPTQIAIAASLGSASLGAGVGYYLGSKHTKKKLQKKIKGNLNE